MIHIELQIQNTITYSLSYFLMKLGMFNDFFGRDWWTVPNGPTIIPLDVESFSSVNDAINFICINQNVNKQNMPPYLRYEIYVLDSIANTRTFVINNGVLLPAYSNNTNINTTQTTKGKQYAPGEALKAYRSGEEVDWEQFVKDRSGG